MATKRRKFTRQGFGYPESAAGQGGEAGPQASSSSDRSSTVVENLASVESNATRHLSCTIDVNNFCIVCGEFIPQKKKFVFSDALKIKYKQLYSIDTSSLDNSYTPKTICSRCRSVLNEINKQVFSKPMIWRSPTNHATDCFFCLTNVKGYNRKNKNLISYPQVRSVNFPVPIHTNTNDSKEINEEELEDLNDEDLLDGSLECDESQNFSTEESDFEENTADAEKWDQDEVSDLCRDLGLSKESSELLASRLKEKKSLSTGTKISLYRSRERTFRKYFSKMKNLVYCHNIEELVKEYDIEYTPSDWRLFIDSSKRSLKAILLHNVFMPLCQLLIQLS